MSTRSRVVSVATYNNNWTLFTTATPITFPGGADHPQRAWYADSPSAAAVLLHAAAHKLDVSVAGEDTFREFNRVRHYKANQIGCVVGP